MTINRPRPDAERLSEYREDANGCWLWLGPVNAKGYGRSGTRLAHRVAYQYWVAPIPAGLEIDHLCRTRLCIRPDHLEVVTHRENIIRGAVYRHRDVCSRGHAMTPDNVYSGAHRPNHRTCRKCAAMNTAAWRQRRLAA